MRGIEENANDAALWNDLAVTMLEQTRSSPHLDARLVTRAMDAAARAIALAPDRPEGHFNLAITLESLALREAAVESWKRAIGLEADAGWRQEVQARLDGLAATAVDDWTVHRRILLDRATPVDEVHVRLAADRWPQQTRELVEDTLLRQWGAALEAHDADGGAVWLTRASRLAGELARATLDELLVETLSRIDRATPSERTVLARGHRAYGEGIELYEASRREAALSAFRRARNAFDAARSPFRVKADLQVGVVLYQMNRFAEAEHRFSSSAAVVERRGYYATIGLARWLEGIALMQRGAFDRALRAYRVAAVAFEKTGERQSLVTVASAAADTLRRIGEHSEGWMFLGRALGDLSQTRSARRRYTVLLNASLFASDDGLRYSALLFQNASMAAARERGTANTLVEGLTRRAHLYAQADDIAAATRDLDEAEPLLRRITSPSARAYVHAWLVRVRAETLMARQPADAVRLFNQAFGLLSKAESSEAPALLLRAGQAALRAGAEGEAERYFQKGLQLFERQLRGLSHVPYRVSYLDETWGLFTALIELYTMRRAHSERAFALAERGRARGTNDMLAPRDHLDLASVQRRLGPADDLLYYIVLDGHVLVWSIQRDADRLFVRSISRAALERQVLAYHQLVDAQRPIVELEPLARALHDLLIPSELAGRRRQGALIVVPDGYLQAVPFAALIGPDGQYLIEQRPIVVAPSAAQVSSAPPAANGPKQPMKPLLVGGSLTGPAAARLGPLPDASAELRDVARLYPSATTLNNERATLAGIRAELPRHNVLHFAGHAIANEEFPWRSQLVLAPDSTNPDGSLSFDNLDTLDLTHLDLVILSACGTAGGRVLRGEGVISLVRPFLARRVPAVIGALWSVEDRASRTLLTRFHSIYVNSRDPAAALQQAQVAAVRGDSVPLRHPRNWAAFVVSTSAPPAAPDQASARVH